MENNLVVRGNLFNTMYFMIKISKFGNLSPGIGSNMTIDKLK